MNSNIKTTNLKNCFICGKQVMELDNQANTFDTFGLDESDDLFKESAFGKVHSKCLAGSKWGAAWYEKMVHRYTNILKYNSIPIDTNSVLFVKEPEREAFILHHTGTYFPFFLKELGNAVSTELGMVIRHQTDFNLEFNNTAFVQQLRKDLESNKKLSFHTLLSNLKMSDQYDMAVLKDAWLTFDKQLKRDWGHNWISCILDYPVLLPKNTVNALTELGVAIPSKIKK